MADATIDSVLKVFDNGTGWGNSAADGVIADSEIEAGGGYQAFADAVTRLPEAEARRVVGSLYGDSERHRFAVTLAPNLASAGMLVRGKVNADHIYGRRELYRERRADLAPRAAALVPESEVAAAYLRTTDQVSADDVVVRALAQARGDGPYWSIAAHAAQSDEMRARVYAQAMTSTSVVARYAAAITARTDEERARVLALPQPSNLSSYGEQLWLAGTMHATRDPAARPATFASAMRAFSQRNVSDGLQFLVLASEAATTEAERGIITLAAAGIYNNSNNGANDRYTALRVLLRNCPPEWRPGYVAQAVDAFNSNPARSFYSLRRALVEFGPPEIRRDIIAGAVLALGKPAGPRLDQLQTLTIAVNPDYTPITY